MRKKEQTKKKVEDKVTIDDVARIAKVSRATAGRVIGKYGNVSATNREKVEHAAAQLNYFPNAMAQSLRSQKTNTIAIVVDRISNKFFSGVIEAIEKEAFKQGYSVIICNTHENRDIEIRQLRALQAKRVDAIIIAPVFTLEEKLSKRDYNLYDNSNIPMVIIDRPLMEVDTKGTLIIGDNFGGTYRATEYLIALNHKKIAVMTTNAFPTEKERVKGFLAAMENHGLACPEDCIFVPEKGDRTKGDFLVKELMTMHADITALIILNIDFFPSVLSGLKDLRKKIPDDLSVIVWDESELTNYLGMTTIVQFPEFMGKVAAKRAIELIKDNTNGEEKETLSTELHIRNSCKKL